MKVFAALCLASAAVAVKLPGYYTKGSEVASSGSGELAQKGPGSGPTSSEVYAYLSAKFDACVDAYGEDECVARAEAYAPPSGELAQKGKGSGSGSLKDSGLDSAGLPPSSLDLDSEDVDAILEGELAQKGPGSGPTDSEIYAYLSAKFDACVEAYGEDECVARAEAYAPPSGELAQKGKGSGSGSGELLSGLDSADLPSDLELAQKGPGSGPTDSEIYAYLSAKFDACVEAYGEDECAAAAEAYAPSTLAQKGPGSRPGPTDSEIYAYVTAKFDACVEAYGEEECIAKAEAMMYEGPTDSEIYAYVSAKFDACVEAYGEEECIARAEAMFGEALAE